MIVDVLLETGWSWDDWLRTPHWIQQVTIDTIRARRERDQREQEDQQREVQRAGR